MIELSIVLSCLAFLIMLWGAMSNQTTIGTIMGFAAFTLAVAALFSGE